MEEYLDYDDKIKPIQEIGILSVELLSKLKKDIPTKKGGGLNEITDLRNKTAKLLGVSIKQVYGITRNWDTQELFTMLTTAEKFINPPALWWKLYKKNKTIYGKKTKQKKVPRVGEKGRKKDSNERQGILF